MFFVVLFHLILLGTKAVLCAEWLGFHLTRKNLCLVSKEQCEFAAWLINADQVHIPWLTSPKAQGGSRAAGGRERERQREM